MSSSLLQLSSATEFVKAKSPTVIRPFAKAATASSKSIFRRPARDRGHDQDAIALVKLVVVAAKEADVFLVDINVHEAPDLPGIIAQMLPDRRKALIHFVEQFRQCRRTAFNICTPSVNRRSAVGISTVIFISIYFPDFEA